MLSRQIYRIAPLILALAMTGCASMSSQGTGEQKSNQGYEGLYNGEMQVAHDAKRTETTAEEAIASGDHALAIGDIDRAMYNYVHALEMSGGDSATLNKIGAIHVSLGNLPLAARAYALSLRIDAKNPTALEGIGLMLLRDRRYEEAKQHLAAALVVEPQRWQSHNGLGMLADLDGEHDTAATHYRQALDNSTGILGTTQKARLQNNLGYSLYMSGDHNAALQYFYRALDSYPDFERPWHNIGLVYTRQGNFDRALDAYLNVMKKPAAYNNIGFLCMINEDYGCAEYYFKVAIKISPSYYVKAHENLDRLKIAR